MGQRLADGSQESLFAPSVANPTLPTATSLAPVAPAIHYRGGLQPYREWRSRPLPAPTSHSSAILDGLVDIVTEEGPVVTARAFQLYVRAADGKKVGSSIREALQGAVSLGQRRGVLVSRTELDGGGPSDAVLRIPGTPDVVRREAGPRGSIQEIPAAEIGALMEHLMSGSRPLTGEALYRAVLARYGKVRLTEQTLAHLARIDPATCRTSGAAGQSQTHSRCARISKVRALGGRNRRCSPRIRSSRTDSQSSRPGSTSICQ